MPTQNAAPSSRTLNLAVFPKGFFDDLVQKKMSLWTWIELASTLDVQGVEMYPHFFESLDEPYLQKVKTAADNAGLAIPMMCNSPDFTIPDAKGRQAEIERTKKIIDATKILGGQYCRVLSGQNRPGLDEAEATKWVIDCITALIPHAEKTGIVMAIENHYKDGLWEYPEFAQSRDRYFAILNGVKSPWLCAQYDPSNAIVAGDDQYKMLEDMLPRMSTVQASDRFLEGGTIEDLRKKDADPKHGYARFVKHGIIGQGLNDYDRIFKILVKAGYKGWISIEDGDGPTPEEGMANLRASVAFLRSKIAQHYGEGK